MRDRRLLIGLGVIVALVALFLVFRPGNDDEEGTGTTTTAATAPPTIEPTPTETETATTVAPEGTQLVVTIRDGEPAGGIVRVTAHKGDLVLIKVRSDVADEVHVHGYDRTADVAPGKPVEILLRANLTGRFEIELEGRGKQIAQLTVLP
jgi:hypothetical protein